MSLFSPVLALMNRTRYAHKFLLIFTVFMLPYCVLSVSKLMDVNQVLEHSRLELEGLESIERYLPVYREALDLTALQIIGFARLQDDAKDAIAAQSARYTQAQQQLNQYLAQGPFTASQAPDIEAVQSSGEGNQNLSQQVMLQSRPIRAITQRMREIALNSKLSQDSEPAVYQAMNQLFDQLVPLYDSISQTRALAGYLTAYSFLEATSRPTILNQTSNLELYLQPDAQGTGALINRAASETAALFKREIVDVYSPSGYFDLDAVEQWLQRYEAYLPQLAVMDQAAAAIRAQATEALQAREAQNLKALIVWSASLTVVVLLLVYMFVGFYLSVRGAINDLTAGTRRMAVGDLSQRVITPARDELGELAENFNDMQTRMSELISQVARFSETTLIKAQGVSDSAGTSQRSVTRQANELELIATSMSELVSNVQEVSQNSQVTADKANVAGDKCREGRVQVDQAVSRINQLFSEMDDSIEAITSVERESQEIAKAVDMIKSVAEQTNLLALNAAIEAARAGDQGRGFAVVADEVRSLAIRSHQLTGEIDQTIERLRAQVGNAVKTIRGSHGSAAQSVEQINLTATIFEQITGSMDQIIDHNIQIASAAEQQAAVVQGVEQNTLEIKSLSDSNAQEAHSTVQISGELTGMTRDLHALIAHFKV